MNKILIIEDEPDMVMGLRDSFEMEGYEVSYACDGEEGFEKALKEKPDLVLLDLMLPKKSGLDVCRELRRNGFGSPIVMLTARSQEIDKVLGLECGADDYVTKPFGLSELHARVRANLRRSSNQVVTVTNYSFSDVEIDFLKHRMTKAGNVVDLTSREFDLLKYLITHRGETLSREQMLDQVWGVDAMTFTRTVDTHIAKLRQKIEADVENPCFIITIHRVGYKFTG